MSQRLLQIIHSYIPIGLFIWLLLWFIPLFSQIERIILFAAFVVVPLALFRVVLSSDSDNTLFIKLLIIFLPTGALLLPISFGITPGILAGLLSIPWSLVTFVIAIEGVLMLIKGRNLSDIAKAIGLIYISVGGIWLIAHQFSLSLLGFQGDIMLLTVNHFHYAGFVVPILFAYLFSYIGKSKIARIGLFLSLIAPILIALGMTYSPIIEWLSVLTFVGSLVIYSTLVFVHVVPKVTRWTKFLHITSSGIIWATMALALIYGYGQWTGQATISIPTMVSFHGWGNAILFTFIGLLAWHTTTMDNETARIPFSKVQGKGKIGADIFQRKQLMESDVKQAPTGLIDDMIAYKSEQFNPDVLHPDIIDFYEKTDRYELLLHPHWSKLFVLPSRVYKWMSNRMEQMNFPLTAESKEQEVESRILPIIDAKDGRDNVRAWVRTYTDTNKAIYAALYSTHVSKGTRYMNIAFPLPFSQMTSVLFLEHGDDNSLSLTSWPSSSEQDQGVYLVFGQKAIRLPINETITVCKDPSSSKGEIEAKHDMWLFGMKFLSLDYHIRYEGESK